LYKFVAEAEIIRSMHYIFVINGRKDKLGVEQQVRNQLQSVDIDYEIYVTTGNGDGTRFVRIYCDLHEKAEVCFVACGGSGTINEVASGIVGFKNKTMAILALSGTTDFCKYYPDLDFSDLKKILSGKETRIDIIKANDFYALNMCNIGFDAAVAIEGNRLSEAGVSRPYEKGLLKCVFTNWYNRIKVTVDGNKINRKALLMCPLANGHYTGGAFKCAPNAKMDDGLIDIVLFYPMSLFSFVRMMKKVKDGSYVNDSFSMKRCRVCRGKHVDVASKSLLYIALDGEIVAARHFTFDILEKEIRLILPSGQNSQK